MTQITSIMVKLQHKHLFCVVNHWINKSAEECFATMLVCYFQGINCTEMTEGYMKCEIQEVHGLEHPSITESLHGHDLISSNSRLVPAQHFNQNISKSPVDVSYCPLEKLTSIIENASYNLTIPEPVGVAQMSDLTLEMQDAYLPIPNFVQNNFAGKVSEGYKPQTAYLTDA